MMTPQQIAEAREVIGRATPGDWKVSPDGIVYVGDIPETALEIAFIAQNSDYNSNALDDGQFVAMAKTGWPAALDALEAHTALADDLKEEIKQLQADRKLAATVLEPIGALIGYEASDLGWVGFADAIRSKLEAAQKELALWREWAKSTPHHPACRTQQLEWDAAALKYGPKPCNCYKSRIPAREG